MPLPSECFIPSLTLDLCRRSTANRRAARWRTRPAAAQNPSLWATMTSSLISPPSRPRRASSSPLPGTESLRCGSDDPPPHTRVTGSFRSKVTGHTLSVTFRSFQATDEIFTISLVVFNKVWCLIYVSSLCLNYCVSNYYAVIRLLFQNLVIKLTSLLLYSYLKEAFSIQKP